MFSRKNQVRTMSASSKPAAARTVADSASVRRGLFRAGKVLVLRREAADHTLPRAAFREHRTDDASIQSDALHLAGEGVDLKAGDRLAAASTAFHPSDGPVHPPKQISQRLRERRRWHWQSPKTCRCSGVAARSRNRAASRRQSSGMDLHPAAIGR